MNYVLMSLSCFYTQFIYGKLLVCPFWATVAAQHGGSVDVDPSLCRNKGLILLQNISYIMDL